MTRLQRDDAIAMLAPVAKMLESDGYALFVKVMDKVVDVSIEATAEACAECLVPQSIMTDVMLNALGADNFRAEGFSLNVRYPADKAT